MSLSQKKKLIVHFLPVFGCFSTAIIYIAIGIIALLSFFKVVDGGADEGSLIVYLYQHLPGKILIGMILSGTLCFIAWRIYECIKDPYGYGHAWKGWTIRIGIALSTLADALITISIIKIIMGKGNIQQNGNPAEEREWVNAILQWSFGPTLIIAIGCMVMVTAIVQVIYGITSGYRERMETEYFNDTIKKLISPLAWIGFISRGIILGIVGMSFLKSGILKDEQRIVNTDKAFDFIGDHIGHVCFILVALGTICYGLFTFFLGLAYDSDRD